ncbi:aminodeoxychorismate synthase component I [Shewanella sp. VB17]|uniref:aminodeoxychorismate synthase component I n=1 Tax=Shewanella sp. VB17 TaxID=2739432 RepID=UPI00156451D5|nr:aminodeoxychorismate synthase component I [Shewanella sp. VB17]NRD74124.1 aminodeoxychorismate synthase component I [Shewanella sp. VB17]
MTFLASPQLASCKLTWKHTTTELFSYFSHQPWAMLLDSANAKHVDAKYDIIVCDPVATIITEANRTEVTHFNAAKVSKVVHVDIDPFDVIKLSLAQYFPHSLASPYPFSGGAMGCFSYDLGRQIEILPSIAQKDIELAEMNIGLYMWALIYDYQLACWTLVHYQGQDALNHKLAELNALIKKPVTQKDCPFSLTSHWYNQTCRQQYLEKFNKIHHYLHSGDCYQINLTHRFEADYHGDEWLAYVELSQINKAPFSAFIRLDNAAILSISPERFIQLHGTDIQTKPIKGTRPRFNDPVEDQRSATALLHAPKDRAENLMIVDLLRNDIGKVAQAGSVEVPTLFNIESFPAVHHLVSTVTAKLDPQYQASDLLKATFPGGSITGAPKIRAMEIIEELEPSRRSLYCGSIGYISQDGNMDTSITIRTLVTQSNRIYCWAGGGIVADSIAEEEYQETYDKVSKILPILKNMSSRIMEE